MDRAISIRGKNIVAGTRTTDNILCLAVLLKAGYKVSFRVTDLDPTDGGDLYTPKGKRIALVFAGNLWRLPMWSPPSRYESTAGIPAHQNPFAALVNVPDNVACTRAASQPVEVSPLELSVADQIPVPRSRRTPVIQHSSAHVQSPTRSRVPCKLSVSPCSFQM